MSLRAPRAGARARAVRPGARRPPTQATPSLRQPKSRTARRQPHPPHPSGLTPTSAFAAATSQAARSPGQTPRHSRPVPGPRRSPSSTRSAGGSVTGAARDTSPAPLPPVPHRPPPPFPPSGARGDASLSPAGTGEEESIHRCTVRVGRLEGDLPLVDGVSISCRGDPLSNLDGEDIRFLAGALSYSCSPTGLWSRFELACPHTSDKEQLEAEDAVASAQNCGTSGVGGASAVGSSRATPTERQADAKDHSVHVMRGGQASSGHNKEAEEDRCQVQQPCEKLAVTVHELRSLQPFV